MIVGLLGFIGSGKGTVGELLVEKHGFHADSFAAPLKDAVSKIFGWPRHLLEGDTEESRVFRELKSEYWSNALGYDVTPRLMLQYMGTEAGRNIFGANLWSASLQHRYYLRSANQDNYVITDVRFPNEIKMLHEMGGITVVVKRGDLPEWYDVALAYNQGKSEEKPKDIHYSEWAWIGEKVDFTIDNNGSIEDLNRNVAAVVSLLTNQRF